MLRDFLNAILVFVGAATLTDLEFTSIELIATNSYSVETYGALLGILDARESVSNSRDRLRYFFLAKDIQVGELPATTSNIFFGAVLE